MSITTIIHEPPVTFGMLPVGTRFRWNSVATGRAEEGFKHGEHDLMNCTTMQGRQFGLCDPCSVEVVSLPPGATLARKPKMVEADNEKQSCFLLNGILCLRESYADGDFIGIRAIPNGPNMLNAKASVNPCRVEVHVYPEYEA